MGDTFLAPARFEDLEGVKVQLRMKMNDPVSLSDYWVSRPVILSSFGATVLEGL